MTIANKSYKEELEEKIDKDFLVMEDENISILSYEFRRTSFIEISLPNCISIGSQAF
jgi:hypothetical protein